MTATLGSSVAAGLASEWALLRELAALQNLGAQNPLTKTLSTSPSWTLIGLDEAGRGCVAGPVVAAATAWHFVAGEPLAQLAEGHASSHSLAEFDWTLMRDSKRLTPGRRKKAAAALQMWSGMPTLDSHALQQDANVSLCPTEPAVLHLHAPEGPSPTAVAEAMAEMHRRRVTLVGCSTAIGLASCQEIEDLNIWGATQRALARALTQLALPNGPVVLIFDGKLPCKLPQAFSRCPLITLIKADDLLRSVSAAGIMAKVTRDDLLEELDVRYPMYGFAKHKGYGTPDHLAAIRSHGLTPEHRPSFLRGILAEQHPGLSRPQTLGQATTQTLF